MALRLMANHLAVRERRRLLMIRWSLSFFSSGSLLMICNHTHTQSTQCVCARVYVRVCVRAFSQSGLTGCGGTSIGEEISGRYSFLLLFLALRLSDEEEEEE